MKYDIIIIGGGASGLCTAINAKTDKNSVLVLEHNDRVGKKILSTGNGHCNLTNSYACANMLEYTPEGLYPYMTSGDPSFAFDCISSFGMEETINFFAEAGLICTNSNGYIYPNSMQASTVLDILRFRCEDLGIDIVTDYHINELNKGNGLFHIDFKYSCEKLVIATGGLSGNNTGNDGSGYKYAESFGHTIVKTVPALCGIKCSDTYFKSLKGTRVDGRLTFTSGSKEISICGNLQFTEYGISGIPAFQVSSIIGYMLANGEHPEIMIDFVPDFSIYDLTAILLKNYENLIKDKNILHPDSRLLLGLLNKNIIPVILREYIQKLSINKPVDEQAMCLSLAKIMKMFVAHPVETMPFSNAQTTAGGVYTKEIDPKTMQSKLVDNLYFAGEVIDVNGICGGYNLQWAWTTGHICGNALKK